MNHSIHTVIYCLMTASLAITYRRYLIQDGGLLAWWPGLFYKALPTNYEKWNGVQKGFEKVLVTCATCQAGQLAFWLALATGSSVIDSLLCAGLSSVIAHILDEKFFAK
jgi:hypothetical protein